MSHATILAIGEVLFDEFPDRRRLGGAPFNVACHLRRFGLPAVFVSRVGNDEAGREIRRRVAAAGLDPADVQQDATHPTGRVRVTLDDAGHPTFDIVPAVAYDHIDLDARTAAHVDAGPALVCFGTLAQRTAAGGRRLRAILDRCPAGTRRLYDMNLRPDGYDRPTVEACLHRCDILKISDTELEAAADMFALTGSVEDRVLRLAERFGIDGVALTLGAGGAEWFAGGARHRAAAQPPGRVRDTVGAGDAFTAVLAAGEYLGWPPQETLATAVSFAARICTVDGAIPEDPAFYRDVAGRVETHAPPATDAD